MKNDHLQHYGVAGMKWGVRRYQNADGSLTNAGRNRYGIIDPRPKTPLKDARYLIDPRPKTPLKDARYLIDPRPKTPIGMKLGAHRYENPDGTLTTAGKKRYSKVENDAKNAAESIRRFRGMENQLIRKRNPDTGEVYLTGEEVQYYNNLMNNANKFIKSHGKKYNNTNYQEVVNNGKSYIEVTYTDKKLPNNIVKVISDYPL